MNKQYLTIMQESLRKKINILEEIVRISKIQAEVLVKEPVDYEAFDRCVDDKDVCIEQLELLDRGFEALYQKVGQELKEYPGEYKEWIRQTQALIEQVTEKSVEIQAMEARNKQAIEDALRKNRQGFRQGKRSAEVARNYYKNMNLSNVVQSQYMDKKK